VVGFRPIDVRVEPSDTGPNGGIAGTVVRSLFLGDVAHYYIRSGSIEVCAHDRPRPDLADGTQVHWHVHPERCLILKD
jgi:hypothetical protein